MPHLTNSLITCNMLLSTASQQRDTEVSSPVKPRPERATSTRFMKSLHTYIHTRDKYSTAVRIDLCNVSASIRHK